MPGENLPKRVWNRQTKFTYTHWLAALVKGKCSSTKPTCLATGVACHPDTEQNRPYKIPWPCRKLNRDLLNRKRELYQCAKLLKCWRSITEMHYDVTSVLKVRSSLNRFESLPEAQTLNTHKTLDLSLWYISYKTMPILTLFLTYIYDTNVHKVTAPDKMTKYPHFKYHFYNKICFYEHLLFKFIIVH